MIKPSYDELKSYQMQNSLDTIILYEVPDLLEEVSDIKFPRNVRNLDSIEKLFGLTQDMNDVNTHYNKILTLATRKFPGYSHSIKSQTDTLYNRLVHVGIKKEWNDSIQITFREYKKNLIVNVLNSWQKLIDNYVTGVRYAPSQYKGNIYELELENFNSIDQFTEDNFNDAIVERLSSVHIYQGVYPESFEKPDKDLEEGGLLTVSASFKVERVVTEHDLKEGLLNQDPDGLLKAIVDKYKNS